MRLDSYLVDNGYFDSRNKANEAIKGGKIEINGEVILKPSFILKKNDIINVDEKGNYVSRASYKLLSLLKYFPIDFVGKRVLDVGASTGGFTQIALERCAKEVICVDVGKSQLHHKIKENPKVKSFESCDIRDFIDDIGFDILLCDVSFISVLYIAEAISALSNGCIVILFKPQFEVGRDSKRDKNGVVSDTKDIENAKQKVVDRFKQLGWNNIYEQSSEIRGKEGNTEIFLCFAHQ